MHVDVALLEGLAVDAERGRAALDEGQRGLRALLHDVAQLSGEDEPAASLDPARLDEEDVAAHRRPGEPRGHPGDGQAHGDLPLEAAWSEDRRQVFDIQVDGCSGTLGDLHRHAAEDLADLALEVSYPRLAGVIADDRAQGLVGERGLPGSESVGLELAPDQIAPADLDLLLLGVAG